MDKSLLQEVKTPRFLIPGTACCYGQTGSGKSFWICKLLKDIEGNFKTLNGEPIKKIVYCYNSAWQPIFDEMKNDYGVRFYEGMPDDVREMFPKDSQPGILILDDLMTMMHNKKEGLENFTINAHHCNLFVCMTQQALFPPGRFSVSARLNFQYKILFKYPTEEVSVKKFLSNTVRGEALNYLYEYYLNCCYNESGYLIIASHARDPNQDFIFRTNVLTSEGFTKIYKRKRKALYHNNFQESKKSKIW